MSRKVEVMDGGMGGELLERGVPFDIHYWSAIALLDERLHHKVVDAHVSYIKAGASYITTSNYTVTSSKGFSLGELKKYTDVAASLALKARAGNRNIKIFGCIPPLRESYRPYEVVKSDDSIAVYKFIAETLAEHVDILLAETISTISEVEMVVDSVKNISLPLYVSFTLSEDGNLRDGTSIVDAIQDTILRSSKVKGVLFNCCSPESITLALEVLYNKGVIFYLTKNNIRLGAYPNRFEKINANWSLSRYKRIKLRQDTTPQRYLDDVKKWIDKGVTLIGGCCGINSVYIQKLSSEFNQHYEQE